MLSPSRIIWDISTVGYVVNPNWCPSALVPTPRLTQDLKWEQDETRHEMRLVRFNAQNCIILYGGTNQMQTKEFVDEVLADFGEGDYLILQNEINMLDYIIDKAYKKR